jgi:nicotinic acid mononucleotide adenylyltransferase
MNNINDIIIFTMGRMNPPTPGHLFLIETLIDKAIENNTNEVFIILSKTVDNDKNPIPCPEKINVLIPMIDLVKEKMKEKNTINADKIQNINIIMLCVPDIPKAGMFTPLIDIINKKQEQLGNVKLYFVSGDDRADLFEQIKKYFSSWKQISSIEGADLDRKGEQTNEGEFTEADKLLLLTPEELESKDMSSIPIHAMSASFVRMLVKYNNREKFKELYSPYLNEEQIDHLYNLIQLGFERPTAIIEKKTKKTKKGGKNKKTKNKKEKKSKKGKQKKQKKNKTKIKQK